MAFRTAVRRWPAASSQARALMRTRQGQQLQQSRAYAEYTGDSLNEKEKAAENRFIRQREAERKLKKEAAGETHVPGEVPIPSTTAEAAKSKGGFPTTAVVAGLAVAVGAYWLFSGSSKKEEKEKA